jgi:hypothetical protein
MVIPTEIIESVSVYEMKLDGRMSFIRDFDSEEQAYNFFNKEEWLDYEFIIMPCFKVNDATPFEER